MKCTNAAEACAEIRTYFFSRDTPKQIHRRWQRILVSVGLRAVSCDCRICYRIYINSSPGKTTMTARQAHLWASTGRGTGLCHARTIQMIRVHDQSVYNPDGLKSRWRFMCIN